MTNNLNIPSDPHGLRDLRGATNQGLAYFQQGDWANARACFQAVMDIDRDQYDIARVYAKCLAHLGHMAECIEILEYCAAKQPEHAGTAWMLANGYNEMGRNAEARTFYDRALALAPSTPLYEWASGLWYAKQRQYLKGLELFKWGYHCKQRLSRAALPEWDGRPAGKPSDVLYICGEMGLGDCVLFGRYVRAAKEKWCGTVILELHDILIPLFTAGGVFHLDCGADAIVMQNENMEMRAPFAEWVNMATLANVLFDSNAYVCAVNGYRFRRLESADQTIKVGLSWQGNTRNPVDKTRSVSLETLLPLLDTPNIEFHSLQFGAEIPDSIPIKNPDIRSTDKLAAAILQMDAVVTVDTMVANLAASLGVKTHVLSTLQSDYRWSGDGKRSDFYPSAVVHRQSKWLDWTEPINEIKEALTALGETHGR